MASARSELRLISTPSFFMSSFCSKCAVSVFVCALICGISVFSVWRLVAVPSPPPLPPSLTSSSPASLPASQTQGRGSVLPTTTHNGLVVRVSYSVESKIFTSTDSTATFATRVVDATRAVAAAAEQQNPPHSFTSESALLSVTSCVVIDGDPEPTLCSSSLAHDGSSTASPYGTDFACRATCGERYPAGELCTIVPVTTATARLTDGAWQQLPDVEACATQRCVSLSTQLMRRPSKSVVRFDVALGSQTMDEAVLIRAEMLSPSVFAAVVCPEADLDCPHCEPPCRWLSLSPE